MYFRMTPFPISSRQPGFPFMLDPTAALGRRRHGLMQECFILVAYFLLGVTCAVFARWTLSAAESADRNLPDGSSPKLWPPLCSPSVVVACWCRSHLTLLCTCPLLRVY